MTIVVVALVALLVPATALAGGAAKKPKPDPELLVLQQKDLPKLKVTPTGPLSVPAKGFVDGYGTVFNPKKAARSGVSGISQAMTFSSTAAAKNALQQMYKSLGGRKQIKTSRGVGQDGRMYAIPLKAKPGGKAKTVPYYYWRFANVVALVSSSGSSTSALGLAKKQQSRIAANLK